MKKRSSKLTRLERRNKANLLVALRAAWWRWKVPFWDIDGCKAMMGE